MSAFRHPAFQSGMSGLSNEAVECWRDECRISQHHAHGIETPNVSEWPNRDTPTSTERARRKWREYRIKGQRTSANVHRRISPQLKFKLEVQALVYPTLKRNILCFSSSLIANIDSRRGHQMDFRGRWAISCHKSVSLDFSMEF
jgi:hypothetical protein